MLKSLPSQVKVTIFGIILSELNNEDMEILNLIT